MSTRDVGCCLTIAGSDSCAGAGLQADLKTFMAHNIHGLSVVTVVTSQNSLGVQRVFGMPRIAVEGQLKSIIQDFTKDIDGIKIGVIFNEEIITAIASKLNEFRVARDDVPIILDPVIISSSGAVLLQPEATAQMVQNLTPIVTLVTPNIPEAVYLLKYFSVEQTINNIDQMKSAAKELQKHLKCKHVMIKGGHLSSSNASSPDVLYDGVDDKHHVFESEKISKNFTKTVDGLSISNWHGTGCTMSSAITCYMAKGVSVSEAVKLSKQYVRDAMENSYHIGGSKTTAQLNHNAQNKKFNL
ncbi:thiamine biosynthetic bifunctional enzyme [Acrasis kona]|uniref:Thiamine biosynthetic bifunctional enzyme n=1 Tax=Acrasis kona TaxID=1008807 RepID=A0AAW2ZQQ6_9EUKA